MEDGDDRTVRFAIGGLPAALTSAPLITKMVDNSLTLVWSPCVPKQPQFPVSYVVEFAKSGDGQWVVYQGGKSRLTANKFCDLMQILSILQTSKIPNVKWPVWNLSKTISFASKWRTSLD